MSTTDFFTFLVDETLKLQEFGERKLSSYELKLTDYSLSYLKGEFIPQLQVLRFSTHFGQLDIPVNWSFFESGAENVLLCAEEDKDHFFEVIKTAWNPEFTKIFVTHADGFCYLVGLKESDQPHLRDLQSSHEWLDDVA